MVDNELNRSKGEFLRQFTSSRIGEAPELKIIDDLISNLSPQARDYLAFLTNIFLEKDIYEKTMNNPDKVGEIKEHFNEFGVDPKSAKILIDMFKKEPEKPQ